MPRQTPPGRVRDIARAACEVFIEKGYRRTLMTDVAGGRGSSALIEGEPGIGKSALVHAAIADASRLGCQVFWGAGDELGQALPLLPMLDALRVREPSPNPRRTTIVRLLRGELAANPGADVSGALAEQLLALVTEEATARPTILVIDDLQWADQATITLWGRLARSVAQVPLMLVGTMRPVPQRDELLALRRTSSGACRLEHAQRPLCVVRERPEHQSAIAASLPG